MPMNYKQYQNEVTADIATILADASCQPILFVGSGFTKRYASGPNWEELLDLLAKGCPLIDKDFAYYKQAHGNDLKKIGSVFSDLYREWAWSNKAKSEFPEEYFTTAYSSDIFVKHVIAELLKNLGPDKAGSYGSAELDEEIDALKKISAHAIITTNYDEVIEPLFPDYERVISQQILRKPYLAIGEIFKIHGCCSDPKSIVVNEADYQRFEEDHKYLSAKLLTYFVEHPVTCWLNVAEELAISDDERKERKSVRQILRGEFQEEDVAALLHLLLRATNPRGTLAVPNSRPTTEPKGVGPKDVVDRPFSFLQWEMSGHVGRGRGGLSVRYDDALSAFVRWLNGGAKTSRGSGGKTAGSTPPKPGLRDVKEEESEKKHGERDDINNSLQTLIQAIPRLLAENPNVDNADVLASVAAAHALRLSLTSIVSDAQRLLPVLNWLDTFSRFEYRDTVRDSLRPMAVGIAMVAAAVSKLRDVAVPGSVLKESLLRFGCDGLSAVELEQLASQALKSEIFARVDQAALSLAPQMCGEVWSAESLDDRILRMVKLSRQEGAKVPMADEEMFPGVFAGLRNHVSRPGKVFRDGVISTSDALKVMHGCPHCYLQLEESIRRALRSKHMVACNRENCHKIIFFLEAPAIADSVRKALRDV